MVHHDAINFVLHNLDPNKWSSYPHKIAKRRLPPCSSIFWVLHSASTGSPIGDPCALAQGRPATAKWCPSSLAKLVDVGYWDWVETNSSIQNVNVHQFSWVLSVSFSSPTTILLTSGRYATSAWGLKLPPLKWLGPKDCHGNGQRLPWHHHRRNPNTCLLSRLGNPCFLKT